MKQPSPWTRETHLQLATGLVLLLVAIGLSVLAALYDTFPGDRTVGEWAQALGDPFEPIAHVFNEYDIHIGVTLGVAAGVALWWRGHLDALAVAMGVAAARPLFQLLKPIVERPRPEGAFPPLDAGTTASFPSGHVLTAVTVASIWFVFAPVLVGERAAWAVRVACVAVVVLMATARMWAGVHWFSDTYGAVIWVAALMLLALWARHRVARHRAARDRRE